MPIRHIALALLVVVIWGFNFVVIKLSVEALPPLLAAALRFLFAALPAVFFVRPPKAPWFIVMGFGLAFGFALYAFLNLSIAWGMSAGLSSLVLQVQAFFTMALAFVLLGERPSRNQVLGALVAFGGIAVIATERAGDVLEHIGAWAFLRRLPESLVELRHDVDGAVERRVGAGLIAPHQA